MRRRQICCMHGGYRGSGITINWNTTPSQNDPIDIPTPIKPPIDNPKNPNNIAKIVGITVGTVSAAAIAGAAAYYNRDKIQSSYNDLIGSYNYNRPVRNMAADERAQGFGEEPYGDVELVAGPADPPGIVREGQGVQQPLIHRLLRSSRDALGNIITAIRPNNPASPQEAGPAEEEIEFDIENADTPRQIGETPRPRRLSELPTPRQLGDTVIP